MPPVNQNPTPSPTPSPTPDPMAPATPPVVPQPSGYNQKPAGVTPLTTENIAKQRKIGIFLAIVSYLLFIAGVIFGFATGAGALLGAVTLAMGVRGKVKSPLLIVMGSIGLALNFGLYTLATILSIANN